MSSADKTERLRQLDTDLLLALDALLQDQNVTQAAKRLGLSQSAMSARLTRLRAVFQDRLFVGTTSGRGVVATPYALSMRNALTTALAALESLMEPNADFDARASTRTFRLAMHDNPAALLAPTLVARCRALAPGVRMAIVRPDALRIDTALESAELDVLFASPSIAHSGWMSRAVVREPFATAQRKQHPRGAAPLDLDAYCELDHLLVSADGGHFSGMVDDLLATLGRERRVVASVQSYAVAPLVVEHSDLICTLPKYLLQRFGPKLDLFEPPVALQDFQLSAFWHERNHEDPAHIWLRERISEAARDVSSV